MPIDGTTPDIFDQWAGAAPPPPARAREDVASAADLRDESAADAETGSTGAAASKATPMALRRALQELLKNGLLEQAAKPHLYRQIASDTARVNAQLEPLDLQVRVDDVRGLAFVAIPPEYQPDGEDDEWTHPLVRRQRLTLEQSLLLAILRREFLQYEQERGIGVPVRLSVDRLLPQLEVYLGHTGSDMQERKRLMNLLENLRTHGAVSEVDTQDSFSVRPMIVHLANPQNLQTLLQHLRDAARPGDAPPAP